MPRLLLSALALALLCLASFASAQPACEIPCHEARMACMQRCGGNPTCPPKCIPAFQACKAEKCFGAPPAAPAPAAPAAAPAPASTFTSAEEPPSPCELGCRDNKAHCIRNCGPNPNCPMGCVQQLAACKAQCPKSQRQLAVESIARDRAAAAAAAAGNKVVERTTSYSTRPVEPDYDPATLRSCSHNVDRKQKGKCAPQDQCYKIGGTELPYNQANCDGPWRCCITTKAFLPLPARKPPTEEVVTSLPEGVFCPISLLEMEEGTEVNEPTLTPAQKKFCADQRKAYLAAKAAKAAKTAPTTPAPSTPTTPNTPRTNGTSSAYRSGQKGQLKDVNNRHHAKNGKFQKETMKNKAGQAFDRRTGKFLPKTNAAKKKALGGNVKATKAAKGAKSPKGPKAPKGAKPASPTTPKKAASPPQTPKKPTSASKRTNGPSSAYRRGQKGQLKDANNRHHAANGRFQKETLKNAKGQAFDRRSGKFVATPPKGRTPAQAAAKARVQALKGRANRAPRAAKAGAPKAGRHGLNLKGLKFVNGTKNANGTKKAKGGNKQFGTMLPPL